MDQESKEPSKYSVDTTPAILLVDPEGKLVTADLRAEKIMDTVRNALK